MSILWLDDTSYKIDKITCERHLLVHQPYFFFFCFMALLLQLVLRIRKDRKKYFFHLKHLLLINVVSKYNINDDVSIFRVTHCFYKQCDILFNVRNSYRWNRKLFRKEFLLSRIWIQIVRFYQLQPSVLYFWDEHGKARFENSISIDKEEWKSDKKGVETIK